MSAGDQTGERQTSMTLSETGFLLTAEEVADLSGYSKPSAQARWLKSNGFPFVIGGDGRPKVLRQVVEQRLGATPVAQKREPQLMLPSMSAASSGKRRLTIDT
ncbi:DUF4224 domain-containing protein [Pseudomonas citronellolis]|uniref:DUF4224 domain-containing protein n=1 Tax=Pseudomonas citronellolis TaxID=53408 RepID=UPI003C2F25E8